MISHSSPFQHAFISHSLRTVPSLPRVGRRMGFPRRPSAGNFEVNL